MSATPDDDHDARLREAAARVRDHARKVADARAHFEGAVRARDDALMGALPLIGRAWRHFEQLVGHGPDGTPWLSGPHMRKIVRFRRHQQPDTTTED